MPDTFCSVWIHYVFSSIQDAGGDARATMWDGRPRPSDCRRRLGKMSKLQRAALRAAPEGIESKQTETRCWAASQVCLRCGVVVPKANRDP